MDETIEELQDEIMEEDSEIRPLTPEEIAKGRRQYRILGIIVTAFIIIALLCIGMLTGFWFCIPLPIIAMVYLILRR